MKLIPFLVLLVGALATTLPVAHAEVTLPAVISNHMVLQADAEAPIWGWAEPGEKVTVKIGDGDQSHEATADANGKWAVKLDKMKPSAIDGEGATTVTISGSNGGEPIKIEDVLVGEVWLCSGQSNMAWTVSRALNPEEEKAAANHPSLRMFMERSPGAGEAKYKGSGQWMVCSPETVLGFSATGYFFGRDLHKELGQPVGLVVSCVGGTPIESWISPEAQRKLPKMKGRFEQLDAQMAKFDPVSAQMAADKAFEDWKEVAAKAKAEGKRAPRAPRRDPDPRSVAPGNLFNGKIAPLIGYGIRGAIWYQGESNARTEESGAFYGKQLPLLVKDWRVRWGQGDFAFAWVQLPNFSNERFLGWKHVRESMLKTLEVPNTGMAIALDLGDPKDIHPKNKQGVGNRLAVWALSNSYGRKDVVPSGPLPAGSEVKDGNVVVSLSYAKGLKAKGGGALIGFEISGDDKQWHPAAARIDGETVVISSDKVADPVGARYAWKDDPEFNLYNGAGIPASPFRTVDW